MEVLTNNTVKDLIEAAIDREIPPKYMNVIMYWHDDTLITGFKVDICGDVEIFSSKVDDVTKDFVDEDVIGKFIDSKGELLTAYNEALSYLVDKIPNEEFDEVIGNREIPY